MFIVTGGAGFIGSCLIWHLNALGIHDIGVVETDPQASQHPNLAELSWRWVLSAEEFLPRLEAGEFAGQIQGVFHLGACSSTMERDEVFLHENNFRTSQRLAQWCLAEGVRYIYASSASTYGDGEHGWDDDDAITHRLRPMNPYGWSKQWMDLWALESGAASQIVGLKFFNVFGPNEYHKGVMSSVVYKAHQQINTTGRLQLFKSHRPEFRDGEQCRDFVYVKDCCEVMWWLWQNRQVAGIFNLGTGQARTWNDLAAAVFTAMGRTPAIDYVDMPEALRSHYQYFTQASMTKLAAAGCPHRFRSLEEAVADYVGQHLDADDPYLAHRPHSAARAA